MVIINLVCVVISILCALVLLFSKKKKEEDTKQYMRVSTWKLIGILSAATAAIEYYLANSFVMPAKVYDRWSLLMVLLMSVTAISIRNGRIWREDVEAEKKKEA